MTVFARIVRCGLLLAGLIAGSATAFADGILPFLPQPPIVIMGTKDIDPSKYDWISDGGRKALADSISQLKSGSLVASVFAAAPGGDYWSYRSASKATDAYTISDLARQALQGCQYYAGGPCFIVAVNGKEARNDDGMPSQPDQLAGQPAAFDPARVPFIPGSDRTLVGGYVAEPKAKVFIVTPGGGWLWRNGDSLFAAVATADADCKKNYPNDTCLLYAVNNLVVYSSAGPN